MAARELPLPIASYKLPSPSASNARLLNCFIEQAPKDSQKGPVILRRGAGIRSWSAQPSDKLPVRGMHVMDDVLYAVKGDTLYSIDEDGQNTVVGDVPGSAPVGMDDNGTDLVIVRTDTGDGYQSDGATVSQITDPVFTGFGGAIRVGFLDGYFVFLPPNSDQVFNSELNAVSFSGLDVFTAEAASGKIRGLLVDAGEIILPKEATSELWYDAANETGSPFSRSPQGRLSIGTAAGRSLGTQDNGVFMLANDKTHRRLAGGTWEKKSQYGIDSQVARLSVISDCFSFNYVQEGHLFIAFTYPSAGRTFVYDCATDEWHERQSYGLGRWRPSCAIEAYGMQLVGDSVTGQIGILDPTIFTEWDDPQVVEWDYQIISAGGNRISHTRFELGINTGDAPLTGQGSSPLCTLKKSDDGGRIYRSMPLKSLGTTGKYKTRVLWTKLGTARDRGYRIQISDPLPIFTVQTMLETEVLRF